MAVVVFFKKAREAEESTVVFKIYDGHYEEPILGSS